MTNLSLLQLFFASPILILAKHFFGVRDMNNPTLEKLVNRKERLEARVKLMKYRAMNKERKDDARRKILVGAYILQQCERDNRLTAFIQELAQFLTRDADKALFKLPFKSIAPADPAPTQTRSEAEPCN